MHELKKKIKTILSVPMLLVFIIICFMFLPKAINMRSAVFRTAIVVALGIDIEEGQYVVDAAINVSATAESLSENTKLVSAKGNSVSSAITNLGIQFGRPIRFGHTRFVLIGINLARENVAKALDGIVRTNKMRDTVQLVLCDAPVDDMLNVGIEIKNKTGIKMSEIIAYQSEYSTTSMDSNVDTFYKGYFSNAGISKINCVTLTDDVTMGITPDAALGEIGGGGGEEPAGGGSAEQSETQSSGQKTKKYLSSMGQIAVFRRGILQNIMPVEISRGTHWINTNYSPQGIEVNIDNETLNNAKVHFFVLDKSVTKEVFMYKGIPIISAKISITLGIDEILNEGNHIIPLSKDIVDQDVKCEIGRKIRLETANAFLYGKENNLDVLELNEIFYLDKYNEYTDYLNKGNTTIDFINDCQISLDIRVEVI